MGCGSVVQLILGFRGERRGDQKCDMIFDPACRRSIAQKGTLRLPKIFVLEAADEG